MTVEMGTVSGDASAPDTRDQWQPKAVCSQTDPEAFFPEKGGSTRDAKRICGLCPVRQECLDYALDNDERFGVWGGLSERERRRLSRGVSVLLPRKHALADRTEQLEVSDHSVRQGRKKAS